MLLGKEIITFHICTNDPVKAVRQPWINFGEARLARALSVYNRKPFLRFENGSRNTGYSGYKCNVGELLPISCESEILSSLNEALAVQSIDF